MTLHDFNKILDSVSAIFGDNPTGPAQGPVTIPADLANAVAALLRDHRESLDHAVRRAGAAIAAEGCAHCKAEFFDKYFARAIDGIGPLDRLRADSAATLKDFEALLKAAPARDTHIGDFMTAPRPSGDIERAGLCAQYRKLADEIDLLDPDLEANGPKFVLLYSEAKAIEATLRGYGIDAPAEARTSIDRNVRVRIKVLQHAYLAVGAEVRVISRRNGGDARKQSVADRARLDVLVKREADISVDLTALGGRFGLAENASGVAAAN